MYEHELSTENLTEDLQYLIDENGLETVLRHLQQALLLNAAEADDNEWPDYAKAWRKSAYALDKTIALADHLGI